MDTDLFFPERGASAKEAMEVCAGCRVAEPCLAMALVQRIHHGIFGGVSERQRRKMTAEQIQDLLDRHSPHRCSGCGAGLRVSAQNAAKTLCSQCRTARGTEARERLLRRSA